MSIGRNPTLNEPEKQFTNAKKASLGLLIITNSLLLLMHSSFIQWPLGKVRLYFNQFPMKVGNTLTTTGLIIKHTGLVIVLSVIYGLFKLISECSDSIPVGNNDSIAGVELDYTNRPEKSQEDSNHDLPILTSSKIIPTIPKADENESPSRASKEMIDYGLYPKALFSNFVKILPTIALSKPIDEKVESIINDKPGTRTTDMLASTDIARKDTEYSKEEGAFSKIKAQNQLESSDKRPEQSQIGRENGELIERQSISGGEQYNSSLARHDKEDVEKPLESQKLLNKSNGFIGNQFLSSEKDDPATFAVEPSKLSSSHSVKASPRYSEREYAATTARALFGMASFAFSTIAKQVGLANDGNQTPSTGSIKDIEIESAKNDPVAKGSQNNRREIPADEGNGGINTSSGTSHHHSVPFPELDNVNLDLPNLQHRNEAKGELPVKPQPLLEIKEYDHTVGSDSPRMIKKTNDSDCLESCIKTTTKPLAAIQTITPPVSNHEEPLQILHANLQNEIMDHGDKRIVRPVKESEISIDIVQSNPKSVFDDIVKVENPKALPDIPIFQVNNSSTEFGKNIRENGSKSIDWIDLVQFEDSRIDPLSKSSPSSPTPEPKNNEHILLESSTNSSDVPPSFSSNKRIETNDASSVGESKSRFSIIKMFSRSKKRKKLVPNTNLVNWGPGSSFRDPNSVAPKKTVRFLEPVDSEHSIEVESSDISIVSKISNNDAYQSNNLDIRDSEVGSISDASETTADDNQTVQNPPFEDTEFKANLFPEPRKFPHLELALFDYEQIDPQQEKFYFNIDRWVDMIDVNGKFAFLPQLESNCNAEANVQFLQPAIPTQSPVPMHAITETNMEPVSLNFSFANLGEIPMAPIFTQHVIELMLDGNGIVNVPSAMFAPLQSHLIVLNLSNNLLTSLPAEIGLLTSLKFLYLRQNRLHQIPNSVGNLSDLQILDIADNGISSIQEKLFLNMDQLQILDLQYNSLRRIPLSVGFLKSLNTLLLAGNPFDLSLDTLLSPILQSQDDDEEVLGNSPAALIKNRKFANSRMKLKPPGYPYLQRLQGYLRDVYDLKTVVPSKHPSNNLDIGPDFLVSCCRIPLTSAVEPTEYRQKLIGELVSTEETYSEQLSLIIKVYIMPIAAVVESKFSELLFSNIQEISELHSELILPSMKQLTNTYNQPIGALFSTVCPYLKIYADYMEHFNISNTLITYLGNPTTSKAKLDVFMSAYIPDNETIKALHSIFRKQSNSVPQLINLQASLLLPVQRLPRYQLLLKSLLNYTPRSHPDFINIQSGLRDISQLIEYCNERKGNSERMLKTLLPLGKIQQTSNLAKFSLVPTPNRGLVSEYHSIQVLKWVQLNNSEIYFQPLQLCKGKNGHFLQQAKGLLSELKFKPVNDLNTQKHARLIENSGKCAKFDCCDLVGKRCTLYLCDDVLLVCSTTFQFVGALPITKSTAVEFLNITSNNIPTDFSIIRLSHPNGILYLKGLNPDINQMDSLVQSLIRK